MAAILAATLAGAGTALLGTHPATAADAGVVRVTAAADTYVSSGRRAGTFGTLDKLVIGRLAGDTKTSYLKFSVDADSVNGSVRAARLRLVAVGGVAAGAVSLSPVPDTSWSQASMTSANAPALSAATRAGTVSGAGVGAQVSFDLTGLVTKPGVYAFAVRSAGSAVTRFRSSEAASGGPELTLTPTKPIPAQPAPTKPIPAQPAPTKPIPALPAPTQTVPAQPAPGGTCVTGALLVPSCGVLWGAAAGGFTTAPRDAALKDWEKTSGRTASIFHTYHKGDETFPTSAEIAMTRDPAHPRALLLNWKVAYNSTWAKVAAGAQDARIDRFAARVNASYPEKFFLVLHHEPENDMQTNAGSGMTGKDYAAMYRHVILRLRAKGVDNAINVLAYMGNEKWMAQSWWKDIYPGDDVVDWIGLDSYVSAEQGYYHYGAFGDLLDRAPTGGGQGFYDWAVSKHPTKPIMVAEWGVYHRVSTSADKAPGYRSVLPELAKRPAIKAIVYFDTERDDQGDRNISIASSPSSLTAFRALAANPLFNVDLNLR